MHKILPGIRLGIMPLIMVIVVPIMVPAIMVQPIMVPAIMVQAIMVQVIMVQAIVVPIIVADFVGPMIAVIGVIVGPLVLDKIYYYNEELN